MSEDSMLKSEILQVLKKQIGGAHKPLHVKLDEPIYEDMDRLNVNPIYSSIDDMETTDEGMFPNLFKNRVNFLNKQKQSNTRVEYPNSYMPKIFFGGAKKLTKAQMKKEASEVIKKIKNATTEDEVFNLQDDFEEKYKSITEKEKTINKDVERVFKASNNQYKKLEKAPKKSKKAPVKKSKKAPKKQPTHVMPDGSVHTGKTHTKDSKVVKPAPKAKKAPSAYNLFVKEFAKTYSGKNLMKEASKAYKASKDSGETLPPPPAEFFDKKYVSKLKRLEKQPKSKKPCKPPQTRNPATGRCKNMGAKPKKEPKPCKPPQVRNPATGRCKKPKKEVKKRQPTAWDLHLKKVRAENPTVKGKQIMILAKQSYNKPSSAKPSSAKPSSAKPSIKIVDFQEPELDDIDDPFLPNPKNNNNDELMDEILDNFKLFIDQMELVANNEMSKKEKQDLFNNIISKLGLYAFQVNEEYGNQLSIAEREEIKKAYKYVEQTFDDTFGILQDGPPDFYLSLEDFGEGDDIDNIILDALEGPNEPLFNQPLTYEDLVKIPDPPPLFKVPERTNASEYSYYNPPEYESDSDAEEYKDYGKTDYFYTDSEYIEDAVLEFLNEPDEEEEIIKEFEASKAPKKKKKKIPLGLRIYQEYLRIFKKEYPDATRKELDDEWKKNKDYYTDLIMDITDLSGGDLTNEDHLFNVFRNMGGAMMSYNKMIGGMHCGGAVTLKKDGTYGNKMYKATHPNIGPMVSNMKYQQPEAPSKKAPSMRKNSPVSRIEKSEDRNIPFITPFLGIKRDERERRLDNAQDWLDTFEDIGKGTFTGLKNVFSLLSPLSWF